MIQFRPMEEKDLEQVMELEKRCFSQAWSKAAMLRELRENSEMAHYTVATGRFLTKLTLPILQWLRITAAAVSAES